MDEVRRLRNERGLSQQRLAELAGVNKVTLVHIENGRGSPKVETLERLAAAMGLEVGDFFPKGQASLFENPEQRRAPDPLPWTAFVNEWATDLEEWAYGFHEGNDPAELPEREFLAFVGGVSVAAGAYGRVKGIVEPLAVQRQDEDLARAWRRLSRVVLAMVTPGVERRLNEMEQGTLPDNVVSLRSRKTA